jgi:hypothetical protein
LDIKSTWKFKHSKIWFSRLQELQTAALAFGGQTAGPDVGATEEYDGSTWATSTTSLGYSKRIV